MRFVSARKINFGMEKMSYTNTKHQLVFVYHKQKKSLGIAPFFVLQTCVFLLKGCDFFGSKTITQICRGTFRNIFFGWCLSYFQATPAS